MAISIVIAFLVTCLFIWALIPVAHRINLVDKPGGRKKHNGSIPLIGGIAMYIGLIIGLDVSDHSFTEVKGLLVAGGILLIVGTIDDYVDLRASVRFLAQIVAALIIIFTDGVILQSLGQLFGNGVVSLEGVATVFTIFAIIGVINTTNMSDGIDGLAGGLSSVAILALVLASGGALASADNYVYSIILATLIAFLLFNLRTPWNKEAKIFMGNGGSMFLGLTIAWLLIHASQGEQAIITPVTALWIFALPLLDTICVMIRRISKGKSPFAPDREHFHHIFLVAGYSTKQSVWIMIVVSSVLATIGLIGYFSKLPEALMFVGILSLFGLYFWGMSHAWKVMKVIRLDNKGSSAGGSVDTPVK